MKHYFSIDIGGTFIKYAILSEVGEVVEIGKFETPSRFEDFLNQILKLIRGYENHFTLHGIAISSPGAVEVNSGVVQGSSAVPFIHGINLRDAIQKSSGYEVSIENDANCAALAEGWLGSAKEVDYFACIVIGTGIGGCIVHKNEVLRGSNLHGGEFGYMITDAESKKPLETIWSLKGSTGALVRLVENQKGLSSGVLNGEMVFKMLDEKDSDVVNCYREWIRSLAVGIYNIQYLLDPQKILIGGGVSQRLEIFSDLNDELKNLRDEVSTLEISVEPCKFKNDANLIGALFHFLKTRKEKL